MVMTQMENPAVAYAVQQGVATLTMQSAPVNALSRAIRVGLIDGIDKALNDNDIQAIVITSSLPIFSGGADISEFSGGDLSPMLPEVLDKIENASKPVVAVLPGPAFGGGLEVALACDIRIAEEHAVMALPEATVGLLPCAGGTQNLAILVGEGWTKRMILCGERVKSERALQIGLVEEVIAKGEGKDAAISLAAKVAKQSPVAVSACKTLIQKNRAMPISQALPQERQAFIDLFDSLDQKEGVQAFLEKRKANFVGE